MYILLGILIIVEIITGAEVVRSVNRYCDANNQSVDERTDVSDSGKFLHVSSRDRCRSGDSMEYLKLDDEAVKGILTVMWMSVRYSEVERLAIDYCIDKLEGGENE